MLKLSRYIWNDKIERFKKMTMQKTIQSQSKFFDKNILNLNNIFYFIWVTFDTTRVKIKNKWYLIAKLHRPFVHVAALNVESLVEATRHVLRAECPITLDSHNLAYGNFDTSLIDDQFVSKAGTNSLFKVQLKLKLYVNIWLNP